MFQIGDTVLYGSDGVCTVSDITTRVFGKDKAEYYILTPIHQQRSVIYVPTASEKLLAKMRRVLSREEIKAIIDEVGTTDCQEWITDENARREHFKTILLSGDRRELMCMIKTIYHHGLTQKENGRKLHHTDEVMMKEAEKVLYDEFAYVLSMKPDDVLPFIIGEIENV